MITIPWHIVDDSLVIAGMQKCASTSLVSVFPERTNAEVARTKDLRVAFIRHPIRRLQSAYKTFKPGGYDIGIPIPNWEFWVDFTLGHDDVHWEPQIHLLSDQNGLIPNRLHRFEILTQVWSRYSDIPLPHLNKSAPSAEAFPTYRIYDLTDKYQEDLKLWEML